MATVAKRTTRAASEVAKSKAATNLPSIRKRKSIENEDENDNQNNTSMNDEADSDIDEEDESKFEEEFTVKNKRQKKSPSKPQPQKSITTPTKPTSKTTSKQSKPTAPVQSSQQKQTPQSSQTTSKKQVSSQQPTPQKKKETKIKYNLKPINIERLATYDQHMGGTLSNEKIIKRLKKLDEYLQDKKRGDTEGLEIVLEVLIDPKFADNKIFDIRLMTSCCLSEIFRIYAPTLPFDMVVLKVVFKLFTEQVLQGDKVDKKLFPQYFQMLERLSVIKVFALLALVDSTMLTPFFRNCLSRVHGDKEHQPMDIMFSTLLNTILESLEEVPTSLWNELLESLIEREKGGVPTAKAIFTHDLIETNSRFLQVHFELFLQDLLEPDIVGQQQQDSTLSNSGVSKQLKKKKNEILFEMFNILPEFIYPALQNLEFDLEDVNPTIRKGAALVLSRCYSTESASDELIAQRPTLYTTFLNRFHDVDIKIRTIMMEFSQHFTTSSEMEMERVLKSVRDRFRDSEPDIRIKAIQVFQAYILKNPEVMNPDLMSEYLERVRDKDGKVRKDAEISLSTVWRSVREKYGHIDSWSNTLIGCFSSIPNTLLHCLGLYDDDKYRIEIAFDSILLPQHSDIKNRSQVFLEIYKYLDEANKQLFKKYLEEKKSLRQEFLALIQFLKNPKVTSTPTSKKPQPQQQQQQQPENDIEVYITHVDNLLPKFIGESSKKLVRQLITPQNKKILDLLVLISDINTTFQEQYNIKISIISKAQNESSFSEFIKYMVNKLAYSIVGKENIKYLLRGLRSDLGLDNFDKNNQIDLLEEFNEKIYEKEIKDGVPETLEVLLMLSNVYPNIFDDYGDQLVGFLTCSKSIVHPMLQILSNSSKTLKLSKKTLKSTLDMLLRLAQVPQPTIARLAFKTFIKFATPALTSVNSTTGKVENNGLVVTLKDLANNLFDQLEDKSKNLLSILEVIGCLAKGYSLVLADHLDTLDILLIKKIMTGPCTLDFNQKVQLNKSEHHLTSYSKDVLIKIAGIKCMSNYLLGLREITKKSHEMVNMLFEFYNGLGKNKTYTDLEKSHLKIHIAIGLLRVFQRSAYEKEITPEQFILICNSTSITTKQRGDPLIRRLIEKLAKVMILNRLPMKYMAAFGMAAQQPYSVLALVRKHTTSIIKTRRMVISRLAASLSMAKNLTEFYPESSMPYFLYVVSHREDFERDAPDYIESACYLNFFIDLLVEEADNYSIIHTIFTKLKRSTDALDKKSKNHIIASELGLQILTHQYQQKKWKPQKHPIVIVLPEKFYTIHDDQDEMSIDDEVASIKLPSLLPKRFKLPPLPAITDQNNNDKNSTTNNDDESDKDENSNNDSSKKNDDDSTVAAKSKISKPPAKKISKKSAAKQKSPKKKTNKKKKQSSSEEELSSSEEEDEEVEDEGDN
ncbi:hypothetical protein RB653_002530 [Dictyostelium firmibasis]|uniref:Uncharacterized protein n=1 Tax=Dictyostelium firmibasis TaxID=79012 RepID=A0AAN7TWK9_9MYCE